jgi:hypothetical protein
MNELRSQIDLKKVSKLTNEQVLVFGHMFGNKGRNFTAETITEKLSKELIPSDTKAADMEKAKEKATKTVEDAFKALKSAGIIESTVGEGDKVVEGSYVLPAYKIDDLPEEKQILIGGKEHTTLTQNPNIVFYKGDGVLYMPHALSPEGKAGQKVGVAKVRSFHVNEEGFLYIIGEKPAQLDKEGKPMKPKTCAIKASKAQLMDTKIPEGAAECVTYKKAAGLQKPELADLSNIDKGDKVLFFNNIWAPNAVHMGQIITGLAKKATGSIVNVNTDHQVAVCSRFNIRTAPTLIRLKDGKEVGRIEDIPAEKPNETILKFLK